VRKPIDIACHLNIIACNKLYFEGMEFMAVTIYDIAKELSVSPSTVSRVLNNSSLISNDTSKKIHDTARRLGYQQRTIKRHQNRTILTIKLVLGPKNDHLLPIFYDFTDILKSIKKGLGNTRINLATEINDADLNLFDNKKSGNIDGVIFAFTKPDQDVYELLKTKQVPNITINRTLPNNDYIDCDNYAGISELISKIMEKRKEFKPCFLYLTPHNDISRERLKCVKQACYQFKVPFSNDDVIQIKSINYIDDSFFKELTFKGYNSLIAMNDVVALALKIRASHYGYHIPKDFSLTGFDESPVINLFPEKLDTISLPLYEIGNNISKWILQKIINKNQEPFQIKLAGEYKKGQTI